MNPFDQITYPPKAALLDYQGRIIVILPGYPVTSSFEFLVKKNMEFGMILVQNSRVLPFFFTRKTPIHRQNGFTPEE